MAKNKNQSNPNGESDGTVTVVLKIDMHCEGCARKVVKSVNSLDGVESVERGENNWKEITVVGKVDPVELCENVERKINKKVEFKYPVTKKKNGAVDKPKKFPETTTVLKVPLHCRGCVKKIQKLVKKRDGFVKISIDESNDLVTVKGGMDINALAAAIKDKLKKEVEIVQAKGGGGGKKGKGGGGGGGGDGKWKGKGKESGGGGPARMEYFAGQSQGQGQGQSQYMYPQYVYRPEYTFNYMNATQMFNDENANACVVM